MLENIAILLIFVICASGIYANNSFFQSNGSRRLQFDGMFEVNANNPKNKKKKYNTVRISKPQMLMKAVEEITLDSERYHMWWTGPPGSDEFRPVEWASNHDPKANALFSMAVIQGMNDTTTCSSPNDLILFLGTARKVYDGDIVIALETDSINEEIKAILKHYKAVVYLLQKDLCSKASKSIFCGSEDERVPASVFKYYFYEKWASLYSDTSFIMITDFRDIIFQSDPFEYRKEEWYPEYQLAVYQEFHPNMVINRCRFNRQIMAECYGEESLRNYGNRIIVSSGAIMGTRDAIIVWTHHMTRQIQEAPGRMVETRCTSGGIDHSFINWLVYGNKLRTLMKIRIFPQGEGAMNSLGGLRPDTVVANISGNLQSFWHLLDDNGYVLNWNGEISPVVHQLDHFLDELITLAKPIITESNVPHSIASKYTGSYKKSNNLRATLLKTLRSSIGNNVRVENDGFIIDDIWQAVAVSRCLFNCKDSIDFSVSSQFFNFYHTQTASAMNDIELTQVTSTLHDDNASLVGDVETVVKVSESVNEVPNMWSKQFIGLYCQYAAVGLLYGTTNTLLPFCVYNFDGPGNVCANASNIVTFAWNIKIFFAIMTDCYRPFGMRRKPWMLMGWAAVLLLLFILAVSVQYMSLSVWLTSLMFMQGFLMLSDVPADGYSVEIGQLEKKEERGLILSTGQFIRYMFSLLAGCIQAFLLNGPTTNDSDCKISPGQCWSWGLTINEYYGLTFAMILVLTIPICWLKELDASHIPLHKFSFFLHEIWLTLQNLTTFYLLIFVIGTSALTNFYSNANVYLQYYIIKLTNLEAGIDTITTYGATSLGIWIFQTYYINKNWRTMNYFSTIFAALLGLVWIAPYYDAGGTMNAWFTIFIDLDTYFVQGLITVLYSLAVIELAKPGQEATTYELIITVGNAAVTFSYILSTQLLYPLDSVGCDDDYGDCPSNTVQVTNKDAFQESHGPERFTNYTIVLTVISIVCCLIFTPFLPKSIDECHEWREKGEKLGTNELRGKISLFLVVVMVLYGFVAGILLLDVKTACQPIVGGSGC